MKIQKKFDPKYAALGVVAILLSIGVLVVLPEVLKRHWEKLGRDTK